jgi:thiol-disulfide isomerase/thioredoxin
MSLRLLVLPVAALFALTACNKDTDGDGLTDKDEADLGTDPNSTDSDQDGVSDSDEVHMGADPLSTDSDGDGYSDGDEIAQHSNPIDADDGIYKGGWPFNPNKGDLDDKGFETAAAGDQIGHFIGDDQYGQAVDLYDFAGHGKPVIIDISAQWCPPCQATASWLSGGTDSYGLEGYYGDVRAAVDAGDIYWVTLLVEDNAGNPATWQTSKQWDTAYPNEAIPVLADPEMSLFYSLEQGGFPSFHAIDENMVIVYRNGDTNQLDFTALDTAMAIVDSE